jgi:hypothetical protein
MAEFIIEIPSIDDAATVYCPDERHDPMPIEPLVRCRDCKHRRPDEDWKGSKWCAILATYFDADFFCGFAERRDA